MATVPGIPAHTAGRTHLIWTWAAVVTGDTCTPVELIHNASDIIEYSSGTYANGTSVTFDGSLDNTNFKVGLVDPAGTAIAHTAADGSAIRDGWLYIRPVVASGSSDAVTITLMARVA